MAGECLNAQGGAMGMPQLCTDWIPNQLFWLAVTLIVMFLILSRVAIPRIGAVLAERKGTITNDLAAAEELKQKARAAERAYEEALADARGEAARIIAATRAEIQKDLDAATAKADVEISAKAAESERRIDEVRAGALAAIETVAREAAVEIVAHLGGKADAGAIAAAVSARVKG